MARHSVISGRKLLAGAAAVLVVAGALTGCSGGGGGEGGSGAKNLVMYNDNPQWTKGFEAAGETIRKEVGYGIKAQSLPTTENYTQTVLAALPTKKSGDLIKWWSGKMLEGLAATGQLADLTAEWEQAVKAGNLNDALRPYFSLDGKVYALPLSQSSWVTYYNKSALKKVGITETPKTWAEYETVIEKLGKAGYPMCTGQTGWETFVPFQQIISAKSTTLYTDLTENKASFTDPKIREGMETWKRWIDNGWVTPPDTKSADCPAMMAAGKLGLMNTATWANGFFKTAGMTDADYGAFLTPPMADGDPAIVVADTAGIAVPKNAPNLDAAKKALVTWMTTGVQQPWSEFVGDFSANPKVTVKDPVLDSILSQVKKQQPAYVNRYYESFPPKFVQSSIATFGGFIVKPDIDATLTELDRQAKQEWAAWEKNPSIG